MIARGIANMSEHHIDLRTLFSRSNRPNPAPRANKGAREREMVSREQHKRASLHEKLQLLRSVTNTHALNKKSIIIDASKYIEGLKQKVERLNREISYARNIAEANIPMVTVETLEKGFLIKVFSEKCCPGLLVSILEVFEDLGLNVLEANASCAETFRLEAFGAEAVMETLDAEVVKQAVQQAIKNCTEISPESSEQDLN